MIFKLVVYVKASLNRLNKRIIGGLATVYLRLKRSFFGVKNNLIGAVLHHGPVVVGGGVATRPQRS
ncbi:hypothetical protein ACVGWK_00085, partial [Enterobacter sichuanensis]